MTKHLVEMHGGSIQVDSQVNQGSTFTVRSTGSSRSHSTATQDEISNTVYQYTKRIVLLEQR